MLSRIELTGTPFEVGHSLGKFGATVAHSYLVSSAPWQSVMAWKGRSAAQAMVSLIQQRFSRIWEELGGLAAGLELPVEEVALWNCRGDVWAMAPDGCTTVQLPSAPSPRMTHNEDGDPGFAGFCAIAEVAIDQGSRFASFVYPASLPGHTFAVTEAGLAMTVNNLRSRDVAVGVPRMILTRALLDQPGVPAALDLLRQTPRAGGFHLTLAQRGHADLWSVEFNAAGVSAKRIQAPALHANHAIHADLRDFPQIITESSRCRQMRGDAMLDEAVRGASMAGSHDGENREPRGRDARKAGPAKGPAVDPLAILADQQNAEFPIYRNAPNDSDAENTMATADIRVENEAVRWDVYERPGEPPRFRLRDARVCAM